MISISSSGKLALKLHVWESLKHYSCSTDVVGRQGELVWTNKPQTSYFETTITTSKFEGWQCPVASPLFGNSGSLSPGARCHQLTRARRGEQYLPALMLRGCRDGQGEGKHELHFLTLPPIFHKAQQDISTTGSFSSLQLGWNGSPG